MGQADLHRHDVDSNIWCENCQDVGCDYCDSPDDLCICCGNTYDECLCRDLEAISCTDDEDDWQDWADAESYYDEPEEYPW